MMLRLERIKEAHLRTLLAQESEEYIREQLKPEHVRLLEENPYCYTVFSGDRILLCGGIREWWPNRGEVWAIFGKNVKREFLAIHRLAKRYLAVCPLRRIEAAVDVNFPEGHRWVKLLGFELEAPRLKAYLPDGRDGSLYARVV